MHDLQELYLCCRKELAALGISCGSVSRVVADGRTVRAWGTCRRERDGSFRITINPKLLGDEVPVSSLRETLLHELLHTAAPGAGHSGRWRDLAEQVNSALGTNIRRTATWADQGLDMQKDSAIRYRYECAGCGSLLVRFRACAFTKHPERYRCGVCGGKFQKK